MTIRRPPRRPAQPEPRREYNGCAAQGEAIRLTDSAYAKLVELWILRVMVKLGASKAMLLTEVILGNEVFNAIGLGVLSQQEMDAEYDRQLAQEMLAQRYHEIERKTPKVPRRRPLEKNLSWLARRLGLSTVEVAILRFMVFTQECEHLNTALGYLESMSLQGSVRTLSVLLDLPEADLAKAMHPDSALSTCGLVTIDSTCRQSFVCKVELLSGICEPLFNEHADPMLMLRERVVPGKTSKLRVSDYPHMTDDVALLRRYFGKSRDRQGVNVLIYGAPGTGKTEFVRMLSKKMGYGLYEVATQQDDHTPLSGNGRLSAYRLAQQMLRKEAKAIILFDEIEDAFQSFDDESPFRHTRKTNGKKAWFNQLLESNPVPAFWLSNSIDAIDIAIIRRFDYVLRMEAPPRPVREGILNRYFEQVSVSHRWIEHLAEHEYLAPGIVERAAKVAAALDDLPSADVERFTSKIISGTLEAMCLPAIRMLGKIAQPRYRPECINTHPPVQEVAKNLATFGQGRICLYGPPGTGKTAFGRYLAEKLGRRLIVKRASDLLGCYVGETEKQIAAMFAQAAEENSVLLLDEADSFLQAREKAVHNWEITATNEMLTQMEQFDGIFIASTNLMHALDEATLRRFDLKVEFRWLAPEQIEHLFSDTAAQLAIPHDPVWSRRTREITALTPGDFANVLRQARLRSIPSAESLHAALLAEVKARPRSSQTQQIGF